ncbi:3-isopropylmalate dehydratase small subunit [Gammaproteobacteria bacterium]|nr:3-isopropylmalate dehydratase small subunit [Gammaproteobacteria bacterium]MDA8924563.1 3-isopropylmalate dehydratase small subunit [Gammaproteobacteria bacterium]MDA9371424.1 3-isopropylmalate dehydratase small subunit [Gammaproteobacteria bacterium]MDB4210633.1 3-isopropylmalate dehydratase small subunit [Gammaproteobacteria bacterium]MDC0091730.1 3-isopropylmalate dehydratase small subunit [Gammaproteobacteria bacterium]|tara:strand:+ start:7854 stop:8486 length:633 start_codon:yes stop_codon:yes gene_type:complete
MSNSSIQGVVAPFDRDNIDTDQIIPTEYLKSIKKFGFEDYLFDGWRYLDQGRLGMTPSERSLNTEFILNQPIFNKSTILLTRDNFGCGSSREHAVWALRDFGFRAVIGSSFGDIFYNNCFKNKILPIKISKENINRLFELSTQGPQSFTISLIEQEIKADHDISISFEVDPNQINRIIHNLDDIDITLSNKEYIESFEENRRSERPWIFE